MIAAGLFRYDRRSEADRSFRKSPSGNSSSRQSRSAIAFSFDLHTPFRQSLSELASQRRGAGRRPAMMRRLFIGVGQPDHVAVVVRPPEESNSSGKIIPGKAGRNDDGG